MSRSVSISAALLAAFMLAGNATFEVRPLVAQQSGGMMEKDSAKMGQKEMMGKMDKMGSDKMMMHDSSMAMHPSMMFMGTAGLKAGGDYQVAGAEGKQKLNLTDHFSVASAPDLYLVLSKGPTPDDGSLYLGKLKQNQGAQSFDLPKGKDLAAFTTLLVWSKKEKRAVASAEWHPASGMMEGKMKEKM